MPLQQKRKRNRPRRRPEMVRSKAEVPRGDRDYENRQPAYVPAPTAREIILSEGRKRAALRFPLDPRDWRGMNAGVIHWFRWSPMLARRADRTPP